MFGPKSIDINGADDIHNFLQHRPIPASFRLFSSLSHFNNKYSFNFKQLKKRRWYAWDLNRKMYDGSRRQNHGAMAAAIIQKF